MRRRDVLPLPLAAAFLPTNAKAQSPMRIGWVTAQRPSSLTPYVEAFEGALRDLGYEPGRNLLIDYRFGDDDVGRVQQLASDLVASRVSLMLVQGAAATVVAAMRLPVPVVFVFSGDPVSAGLAESLARPRQNLTGLTFMAAEMNEKRLEILRDVIPTLHHVGLLANPEHPGEQLERDYSQQMARKLGLEVSYFPTRSADELVAAFSAIDNAGVEGLCVFADGFAVQNRDAIAAFGLRKRLPIVSGWSVLARSGVLCTYGPRLTESYRRLAYYVDRILRGAPPAALPIEQPTQLELIINQTTAKALALTIPPSLLARADEVIE